MSHRRFGRIRDMTLVNLVTDESRSVRQFQYVVWPAHGKPPMRGAIPALLAAISEYQHSKVVFNSEADIYGNVEVRIHMT